MKTLLVIALVHCVALLIQGAAVPPADAEPQEAKTAPEPDAVPANSANRAALRQARFSFCLDGWTSFRGSCYYLGNSADSWAYAEVGQHLFMTSAAAFGASLASVHNIWEYSFLQRLMKTAGHSFAWIGGYYFEGAWRWEDGTPFDYDNWDKEDSPDLFQCLQMDSQAGQGWSSHDCSTPFPFLCKLNPNC
ncbi:hypothetical protein fugu_008337 [Takifugu bimaculatus]|uniref:C-type lectin domain-containing protein n=1 Tax=Takifugu bimaculatus TaxID=433685 RepID=A0A4Z2B378_9TELE|nr:hypothetical protein fugu_008337 [Takifugu bimaculatus]